MVRILDSYRCPSREVVFHKVAIKWKITGSFTVVHSAEKYDLKDITDAWIHLTFKDFVPDRENAEPELKIKVSPVSVDLK